MPTNEHISPTPMDSSISSVDEPEQQTCFHFLKPAVPPVKTALPNNKKEKRKAKVIKLKLQTKLAGTGGRTSSTPSDKKRKPETANISGTSSCSNISQNNNKIPRLDDHAPDEQIVILDDMASMDHSGHHKPRSSLMVYIQQAGKGNILNSVAHNSSQFDSDFKKSIR